MSDPLPPMLCAWCGKPIPMHGPYLMPCQCRATGYLSQLASLLKERDQLRGLLSIVAAQDTGHIYVQITIPHGVMKDIKETLAKIDKELGQ